VQDAMMNVESSVIFSVGDFRPKAFSYVNFPLYAVSLRILDT
jgi:hypothetical protein